MKAGVNVRQPYKAENAQDGKDRPDEHGCERAGLKEYL